MKESIIDLMNSLGTWAVFILIVLEYACFPMPSEIVLPLAGYYASRGQMTFPGILMLSILAGLLGSSAMYAVGYSGGRALLNYVAAKFKWSRQSIQAAIAWFDRYGRGSLLAARVIPIARTYISLVAGAARMRFDRFIFLSLLGISIWNLVLVGLGYYLGSNWDRALIFYGRYRALLIPAAIFLALFLICRRFRKR